MTAEAILLEAEKSGLCLRLDGELIKISPPRLLTPEFKQVLCANKPALLEALSARERLTAEIKEVVFPEAKLVEVQQVNGAAAVAAMPANEPEPADNGREENPRSTIDLSVRYELENWERQLVALGWPTDRIWNHDFWPHSDNRPRGLASVLQRGDRIQFADNNFAHILKRDGSRQRFPKDE